MAVAVLNSRLRLASFSDLSMLASHLTHHGVDQEAAGGEAGLYWTYPLLSSSISKIVSKLLFYKVMKSASKRLEIMYNKVRKKN